MARGHVLGKSDPPGWADCTRAHHRRVQSGWKSGRVGWGQHSASARCRTFECSFRFVGLVPVHLNQLDVIRPLLLEAQICDTDFVFGIRDHLGLSILKAEVALYLRAQFFVNLILNYWPFFLLQGCLPGIVASKKPRQAVLAIVLGPNGLQVIFGALLPSD